MKKSTSKTLSSHPEAKKTIKISTKCSGSGRSGRAMAFCVGQLGSNTEMDLGFFQFRIAVDLLSLGVGLFNYK